MARRRGIEGAVTLMLELRADGTVGEVKISKSSGATILDTAATDAVKQWTHVPATRQGTPVTQWATQEVTFTQQEARR